MSEPLFAPPIKFRLLKAVSTGKLQAIDVVIYEYLLAHTDDWVIREADISEFFSLSHGSYVRAMRRLKDIGLIADGGYDHATKRRKPPKLKRLGQYEKPGPKARTTGGPITNQVTHQESKTTGGPGSERAEVIDAPGVVPALDLRPEDVTASRDLDPDLFSPEDVRASRELTPATSEHDCPHCALALGRRDKLSMHIYAEHRGGYDDFIKSLSS